ncbi:hypothetical protein CHS0354_004745 [Potamilus streckersoni]|uniref:Uncharacterized protein n=1 Tax=Potamilus streckersoni TaxID=2493646 RepID=A0AAE0TCW6_9BIVA|nr:hypothetical protein CHS0354_004745 [Potamilus streckersoni]
MLEFYFIIAFTFFLEAIPVGSVDKCQYGNYRNGYYYTYCDYGCCGITNNNVCCESFEMTQKGDVIKAEAVFVSLCGYFVLIVLIVAFRATSNNSRTGSVIQAPNTTTETSAVSNMGVTQGPPNNLGYYRPVCYDYSGGFLPPAYSQYNNVPQGGTDPAYPPPPPLPPPPEAKN